MASRRPPQVFLTESHLAVALEYADGGELFDAVAKAGKLPEIEVGLGSRLGLELG